METRQPRMIIPDSWAEKVKCPVCHNQPLFVKHTEGSADTLACSQCGSSFQVAAQSAEVNFVRVPSILVEELYNRWLGMDQVRQIVGKASANHKAAAAKNSGQDRIQAGEEDNSSKRGDEVESSTQKQDYILETQGETRRDPFATVSAAPAGSISDQVWALFSLGNSSEQVINILGRQYPDERAEIQAAIDDYESHQKGIQRKNLSRFGLITAIVGFFIIISVLVTQFFVMKMRAGQIPGGASTQASSVDVSRLPAPLQTLIPPGVAVIAAPPPEVVQVTGAELPEIRCPETPGEAAMSFGGRTGDWSGDSSGWLFLSTSPGSIKVPLAMSAAYMVVGQELQMEVVRGPVILNNAYMVTISCR